MSSIPQNYCDENELIDCVQRFFSRHHVGKLLAKCNGMKEKGVSPVSLLRYKLSNIFVGRSMYMQQRTGSFKEDFSKNTFYRFLNSAKTNWLRFTSLLAADIVNNDLKDLTDDSRKNVFIVDDSLFSRTSCKKTELGSKVFDHTDMHFKKGFRMLTLSWSDGNTLIPVNSCLLASAKEANIIGPVKNFDNRTIAGKRRKLAQTKAPEAMMALLDTALSAGLKADYVLFDSWFSNPAQITAIHSKGMDVIAMLKKSSRIKYSYCGEQLNIKEIYSRNKKRRGRSKYLLSVDVMVGKENPIHVFLHDHRLCYYITEIPFYSTFSSLLYKVLSRPRHSHRAFVYWLDSDRKACRCLRYFFDFKAQTTFTVCKHIAISDAI